MEMHMKLFKKIFHKKEEEETESIAFEMDEVTEEMPESRYTEEYQEFVKKKLEEEPDIDPFADLAAMEDDGEE